ncbi:MAG: ferredoxin [Fidelibacterota bacterium]
MSQRYSKHIFVCVNERVVDHPKGSCARCQGSDVRLKFVELINASGLKGQVRANKSGCLDACEMGVSVVVYPDATWYTRVRVEDVEDIFNTSVLNDGIVERLAATAETWQELNHLRERN